MPARHRRGPQNRNGAESAEAERVARKVLELTDQPEVELIAYNLLGVSFYDRTPVDGSAALLEQNMIQAEAAFREAHRLDQGKTESSTLELGVGAGMAGSSRGEGPFQRSVNPPPSDGAAGLSRWRPLR